MCKSWLPVLRIIIMKFKGTMLGRMIIEFKGTMLGRIIIIEMYRGTCITIENKEIATIGKRM